MKTAKTTKARTKKPTTSLSDYWKLNALAWDTRKMLYYLTISTKERAIKGPFKEALKAINNAMTEMNKARKRDYPTTEFAAGALDD